MAGGSQMTRPRDGQDALPPVSGRAILLLVLATFGVGMAMIVPMSYTLAVRIDEIAPGRTDLLGLILGIGSAATLVTAPLTGILSDRTRSRWGRRRPFTVIGTLVGVAAVPVMAFAPDAVVLAAGWVLSTTGWNTAGGSIGNWQADRLPPAQRGRVSGLTTLMMQTAPVIGILLVTPVRGAGWIFLIPAAIGLVLVAAFAVLARDPDSRDLRFDDPLTVRRLLASYVFRPGAFPDFTWNWVGRFVFFLGLTLTSSFSAFFFAQRLSLPVSEVAAVYATTSVISLAAMAAGSLAGGWWSDCVGRRPVLLLGAVLFASGCAVSAFAWSLATIVVGTLVTGLGIALFTTSSGALSLDVLPHRETQAGRYMAITLLSQKIPGVLAPLAAPLLLSAGGGEDDFTLLYLAAALLAAAGGVLIVCGVRGTR